MQQSSGFRSVALAVLAAAACGKDGGGAPAAVDAAAPPDGLSPADAAAVSGPTLYAGSGTEIHALRVDPLTGRLTHHDRVAAGDDVRYADLDATGEHLYVQTQVGNAYAVFTFDVQADGRLKKTGEVVFPYPTIEGASQVLAHPTAPWFLISVSERLAGLEDHLMPILPDGQLGPARVMAREFYGFNWDPSGRFFYGLDGVALSQYRFDAVTGELEPLSPAKADGSIDHPLLGLEVHPGGRWGYTVEEDVLGRFTLDPASGRLAAPTWYPGPRPDEPVLWTSLALAADGRALYAHGHLPDSERGLVDVFTVHPETGNLTHLQRQAGDADRALVDTGLQAPVLLGDWLWVGGTGMGRYEGQAVVTGYRVGPDGSLAHGGEPAPLPGSDGAITFLLVRPE